MTRDGVAHIVCALLFYGGLALLLEQLGLRLEHRREESGGRRRPW